jgi:hypothetical protein
MKYLLLLFVTNICFAFNSFEQKCELIHGSGPFEEFKINYEFLDYGKFQLKSVKAKWSKLSFQKNSRATLNDIYVAQDFNNLDTPTLVFELNSIGAWGSASVNIGSDQTKQVTAVVNYSSDTTANRGVYKCSSFNKRLFQNLY